jgi:protein gp37
MLTQPYLFLSNPLADPATVEMAKQISENAENQGFQVGALKDRYGQQGLKWLLSTCPWDCACSLGCWMCPGRLITVKLLLRGVATPAMFLHENLTWPFRWERPRIISVCPHGDLFNPDISRTDILRTMAVMAVCSRHTYMLLTKRINRMADIFTDRYFFEEVLEEGGKLFGAHFGLGRQWHDHIWLGTSVESQEYMWRAEKLTSIPIGHKMAFVAPQLDKVELTAPVRRDIEWIIQNREKGAYGEPRYCDPWHVKDLQLQCASAGIPFFSEDLLTKSLVGLIGIENIRQKPVSFAV